MNLENISWNDITYQQYIEDLKSKADLSYLRFQSSLIPTTKYPLLGVRIPMMRKIAKSILKGDAISFLTCCKSLYYEEVFIEGLVIAGLDEEHFDRYFSSFLLKIDNWAICDSFCSSLKMISKKKEKYWDVVCKLLTSDQEFSLRAGLVICLNYFLEENYFPSIFSFLDQISHHTYYVQMGIAWLVSEIYIRYPNEGLKYLKQNQLDSFTQNKAISKIHDSYRVSEREKEMVKKYRK